MALPKRPLVGRIARPAGSHAIRADPQVVTRQRMAVLAVRLAQVPLILGVGDELQMVWIPARVDATSVVKLLISWNVAAKELPAEPMRLARSGAGRVVPGCVIAQQLPSSTWCPMRASLWHARSNHMPSSRHLGRTAVKQMGELVSGVREGLGQVPT
jgi:hypothetical protein